MRAHWIVLLGVASAALACGDPVHDNQVSSLGPEASGVPPGPTHRAGQPCLACHGGSGPASSQFALAGTVYGVKGQSTPIGGVTVELTDSTGAVVDSQTNSAGNFYVPFADFAPAYPVKVKISLQKVSATMGTHIGRDGSCATCHRDPPSPTSAGRVFLVLDPNDLPMGTP